ncbi:MAG: OPT/YSL family transporter [Sediminibacterium sp. Gen4]|uniref:OPT family oligopeptide transporter n=1 Tax=unclassified Sediminibacterium TaxID=2635961 RepID=UPI0015BAADF7|nr:MULTISPECIES: OPT/YSL family transporter [unclassified Sediminibacterium]MBW0159834.1 OPT/YSL family transporter [Sediminibacterium sp.]MBW0163876.1 OPT/YSL family transporter [Sediminibacterium sp.]NWK66323.1 OPT/YSL family transporter [Sediminibacterium sp. Gen4]
MSQPQKSFKPFVSPETNMKELTVKSILVGSLFGVIFGAATVYLALKAGLTVSASIPIAVIAITLGRKFLKTTILENNIIQTTGSAGESIAAGVAFTLPGFLFLSSPSSAEYFNYLTILILAIVGGLLGTLLMVPLRKALIVNEHDNLPYPEGTACGDVLKAGERGGDFAKTAFWGLGVAFVYAILQKVMHVIAETPFYATKQINKFFPSAKVSGEITPEYLGVGYIIGPKIAGVLVAGSVLSWMVFIPLLSTLVPPDVIAIQLVKLGYLSDIANAGGKGGWDPVTHTFNDYSAAIYYAYVRQVGAGTVAAGGIITLVKTIPTIVKSVKGSMASLRGGSSAAESSVSRTDKDLSLKVVGLGSLALIAIISVIPSLPGDGFMQKILIGILVVLFGALFVTVSSRIVGLIGSSNNPISGMTIATVMGTSLIFLSLGWSGQAYEPLVLVVGGMICIAAANAGATSQDLKSGYIVGATPRNQQIALFVGAIVSSIVIGITVKFLDKPTTEMIQQGVQHAIGTEKYPAPQATLMATLIKGILSQNLDWQYVIVGMFLAVVMELCGIKSLSFAIGVYLPLATTLPIFIGGAVRGLVEGRQKKEKKEVSAEEEELSKGSLFATGLVAGGAVAGVVIAFITGTSGGEQFLRNISMEHGLVELLSENGYFLLGTLFFALMGLILYRVAMKKTE